MNCIWNKSYLIFWNRCMCIEASCCWPLPYCHVFLFAFPLFKVSSRAARPSDCIAQVRIETRYAALGGRVWNQNGGNKTRNKKHKNFAAHNMYISVRACKCCFVSEEEKKNQIGENALFYGMLSCCCSFAVCAWASPRPSGHNTTAELHHVNRTNVIFILYFIDHGTVPIRNIHWIIYFFFVLLRFIPFDSKWPTSAGILKSYTSLARIHKMMMKKKIAHTKLLLFDSIVRGHTCSRSDFFYLVRAAMACDLEERRYHVRITCTSRCA